MLYHLERHKQVKVTDPDNWYPEWDLRPGLDEKRDTITMCVGLVTWEDGTNTVTCYAKGSDHVIYTLSFTCADFLMAWRMYGFYANSVYGVASEDDIDTNWFLSRGFERFWKGN